ncbi:hypothetical protein [Streptomyces europaeiscabiei]|uniref:hypothetical protein n=1 Tax=Streptomyces europaeiscabiei TaxID=146819 RepID=UPI0038F80932
MHATTGSLTAPDARTHLAVIEDAGHDVHLDQPQRLYAAMAGFLNSLPMGNS